MKRTEDNQLQNKNSFILYLDNEAIFSALPNEDAGILIKAIFHYVHTGEFPTLTGILKFAFIPIQQSLHRDLLKWRNIKSLRAELGSRGGVAKASKSYQKLAKASKTYQSVANVAVSVNVSVNVFSIEVLNKIQEFMEHRKEIKKAFTQRALDLFCNKLQTKFKTDEERIATINQSIEAGWSTVFPLNKSQQKEPIDSIQSRYR